MGMNLIIQKSVNPRLKKVRDVQSVLETDAYLPG